MLKKAKEILLNERGSAFIENGLWIVVVILIVAGAGYALANQGIKSKFNEIQSTVSSVQTPSIGQ